MKIPAYLNYPLQQPDFSEFAASIKKILQSGEGACIVRNFPLSEDNSFLLLLADTLGEIVNEPRNIDGKSVYRVEVNDNLDTPTYANTSYEFLCHTDCSEFDPPPDTVLLLCEKQAQTGGRSFIVQVREIIENLTAAEIMTLSQPKFPFGNKLYRILEFVNEQPVIRYNRVPLDYYKKFHNFYFDEETTQVLDNLDPIMSGLKITFKLKSGECLIINNKTILHGRTEFPEKSSRLMKRIRINLK